MRLGDLRIDILSDGVFRLDGGAMFGVVPKALWERRCAPDEQNRILMGLNCLLVRGRGRTVLVETGMGTRWPEKQARIYDVEPSRPGLLADLQAHGVSPDEVTDVVLTHLHFDHVGGAVVADGDRLRPAFPGATAHVQADMWHWARNPEAKDAASFRPDDIEPLEEGDLKLHEGGGEVIDGLRLVPAFGHTVGHQVVQIETDEGGLLFTADLCPTAAHLRLPYVMAYDLFPQTTLKEKEEILGRAADGEWLVVFCHDPGLPCARIRRDAKGFAVAEIVEERPAP